MAKLCADLSAHHNSLHLHNVSCMADGRVFAMRSFQSFTHCITSCGFMQTAQAA